MTFTNKWGTDYPESTRKFIKPGNIIDITPEIVEKARKITGSAKTTDDAILSIHAWIKHSMPSGKLPPVPDIPVRSASAQLKEIEDNPDGGNLSYNKVNVEVALLRAVDIPARPATFFCDMTTEPRILTRTMQRLTSASPIPYTFHHATEVYDATIGKFTLKESWVPESECKKFPGSCIFDEKREWMKTREIKDLQRSFQCKRVKDHHDYPAGFSLIVNMLNSLVNASHVTDFAGGTR